MKKTIAELQAEVDEKIRLGILPEGAVVSVCNTPGCTHWAHGLEENVIGVIE